MVLQISRVSCTQVALRRGVTTHLPTVRLGLQSARLQFNQRSYRRVVEYVRGAKKRARTASPSRSDAQPEHGKRPAKPCTRWRTEQTEQTFLKGSSELTSATMLERSSPHVPLTVPREEAPSALRSPQASDFPGETHALISPLYYTTHHSCITRYILHTQYAPHLAGVLPQGGLFLNPPAQPLF